MIPGMNPKQMERMMRQMGIKQEPVDAVRIEIFLTDGSKLVFDEPDVAKVQMMGQETYQLQGTPRIEEADTLPDISDEDVQTVVEQTGATPEEARQAIVDAGGDLAEAILKLSE